MRLAKRLAHAGVASRRSAEKMIRGGRVRVADEVVRDPATAVGEDDRIEVDGEPIEDEPREVWVANKPAGVVSTAREPGRRKAVIELVDSERRLYPIGRLDADSTGLILLSNDGELANRLTHPRYQVPKTYRLRLVRPPNERQLQRLRDGVELDDGPTAPAVVERVGETEIEVTIREGRKRQLRRMAETVGNSVVSLTRIRFGSLELGELGPGGARKLSPDEVEALWKDSRLMEDEG